MPGKILLTDTSAEIVDDARAMSPTGFELAGSSRQTREQPIGNVFDNVLRVDRGERPLWAVPELRDMAMRS